MLGQQLADLRCVVGDEDFERFGGLIGAWHGHCSDG
jgi:hypothetical protein